MRDQHDTQTSDLIPAKRGRPVLDVQAGPMTPAERAKRYRQNRRSDAKSATRRAGTAVAALLHEYSDIALLEAIRLERAFLHGLLSSTGNRGATPSRKRLGALVAELARRYPA
ncbi:hypothetical protein PQS31_00080 [Luteimonas sp BLCC-B24]|uniref:hypothetical protein n=1 Tax=Luteimonas sp. BLCC-B24 TaxID=3025317 RepID=UPI00234D609E|nr:hypothetical protein [Luteimonas sp. BLCC-B24]MDC7805228.1 hypothetical protein [Luteimonas sp. BLCC-B24]